MLAFKIMNDPFVGSLTFCRIYSGKLERARLLNTVKDKKERVGRMLLMHANNREHIKEAYAGDIVALGRPQGHHDRRHAVRSAEAGHPRAHGIPGAGHRDRVEPKSKADQEKMGLALATLAAEDPSFRVKTDESRARPSSRAWANCTSTSSSTACARVQGRSQYRRAAGGLSRDDHPQGRDDYTHKKQTGGSGQFARVKIRFEPNEPARASCSRTKIVGGAVPKEYIPGVEKGLARSWKTACSPASR
jgi:elongation factor G